MDVFRETYLENGWGSDESRSGTGSTVAATASIRAALPSIIDQHGIGSMLDVPCGDFNWMKLLDLPIVYIGADVVPELIAENNRQFAKPGRTFSVLDLTQDQLPKADLILCRDCLFHLSYSDVFKALARIKASGARYLLTTTNPNVQNRDITTGEWRRLDLQSKPFSLPEPLLLISEDDVEGKSIGLWRIDSL